MPREMTDVERVINEQLEWATPATTDDAVMDEGTHFRFWINAALEYWLEREERRPTVGKEYDYDWVYMRRSRQSWEPIPAPRIDDRIYGIDVEDE